MAKESYKEKLVVLLRERSARLNWADLSPLCAQALAGELCASRNVVSQYLNELVEEGSAIKVNTRPVAFLDRAALGKPGHTVPGGAFDSPEALRRALEDGAPSDSVFQGLIGSNGSLSSCVEQCKSAAHYPGNGLPILLYGPTGTGKTMLARLTYDYMREKGFIGGQGRFIHVNCSEYANNPELFLTNLFGYAKGAYTGADRGRPGLISLADGGLLFLDEVHCLAASCQEKLFQFMDTGAYHIVGDNDTWYHSQVRLIFATTEKPEDALLRTLLRRIPIIAQLPPLSARPTAERRLLIRHILGMEQERLGRRISISSLAYQYVLNHDFPGNAGDLVNCLRSCLAKAILYSGDGDVALRASYLPDHLLTANGFPLGNRRQGQQAMLTLEDLYDMPLEGSYLQSLHSGLLALYARREEEGGPQALLPGCRALIGKLIDQLFFKVCFDEGRERFAAGFLKKIYDALDQKYDFPKPTGQELEAAARLVLELSDSQPQQVDKEGLLGLSEALRSENPAVWKIAAEMSESVANSLIQPGRLSDAILRLMILDLFLLLCYYRGQSSLHRVPCILAAHGRSTASSIAQAANQMLHCHLFDAIDMPADSEPGLILTELSRYLGRFEGCGEAAVLVDMGSLEQLGEKLELPNGMSLGVVNNVTTKLALDIGELLLSGESVRAAMESACAKNSFSQAYYENRRHRNVILTVCSTGIMTAERIASLLSESMPKHIDLCFVPHDYRTLHSMGLESPVFLQERVILIVGTMDPAVPGVPFCSVEQLIQQQDNLWLQSAFQEFMTRAELQEFERQLLKNFSLMNLLDHLTILNPEKIIGHVESIVEQMQRELGTVFFNRTVVGLYIHISCLIERLITDRYISHYPDEQGLLEQSAEFVDLIRRCFQKVETAYGVKIPLSEIGYLYEYVRYAVEESASKPGGEVSN